MEKEFFYTMRFYRPVSRTPVSWSYSQTGRTPKSAGQEVTFVREYLAEVLDEVVAIRVYKVESYCILARPVSPDVVQRRIYYVRVVPDDVYEKLWEAQIDFWRKELLRKEFLVRTWGGTGPLLKK